MPASSEQINTYHVGDILCGNYLANYRYTITRKGVLVKVAKILTNNYLLVRVIDKKTLEQERCLGLYTVKAECFDLYTGTIEERESDSTDDWKQILEAGGISV